MSRKLLFILALVIAGCTRSLEQAEVSGVYEFKLESMKQQVTIDANGKYVNAFYRDGVLVWSDQGTWIYEKSGGQMGIAFAEFRFGPFNNLRIGGLEYSSGPGLWFVVPEDTFTGSKKLCFDADDAGRCFQARSSR